MILFIAIKFCYFFIELLDQLMGLLPLLSLGQVYYIPCNDIY